MIAVSQTFLDSIGKPIMLDLRGTITTSTETISWNKANIVRNSFSISDKCVKGNTFCLGTVNYASLNCVLYLQGVSAYSLVGQTISVEYGCNEEYIQLGVFEIVKASTTGKQTISITASTQLARVNVKDDKQSLPATWLSDGQPYSILQQLCTHAGITLASTQPEIEALPNGTITIGLQDSCTISSTSELLSYVATILGGFVTSDRYTGGVKISTFKTTPCYTVPLRTIYRNTLHTAGFKVNMICVLANFYENGAWSSYAAAGKNRESANDVTIDFSDNPFLDTYYRNNNKNLETIIDREREVGDATIVVPYNPFELSVAGNPALELGDCINIELQDGTYLTTVISYSEFNFRGKHTLKCLGEDTRTVGGLGVTDTLRLEEHVNQRINAISRTPLMKKSEYKSLGNNIQKGVLYCLYDDDEVST